MDVTLTFLTFDLENDPLPGGEGDCKYDWLEVWDGLPGGTTLIRLFGFAFGSCSPLKMAVMLVSYSESMLIMMIVMEMINNNSAIS